MIDLKKQATDIANGIKNILDESFSSLGNIFAGKHPKLYLTKENEIRNKILASEQAIVYNIIESKSSH